jgi:hypothetical protein
VWVVPVWVVPLWVVLLWVMVGISGSVGRGDVRGAAACRADRGVAGGAELRAFVGSGG